MKVRCSDRKISFKSIASNKVAQKVSDVILSYRRPFQGDVLSRSDYSYLSKIISEKIKPSINAAEPIPIGIVGFSMKSPNSKKVISQIADRAEFETLEHLSGITKEIKAVYPYGSDFKIFADGRIFVGTIYGSTDSAVSKYIKTNQNFLKKIQTDEIKLTTLDDIYGSDGNISRMRLFKEFPVNKEEMEAKTKNDLILKKYRQYMRDFYAKDIHAINPSISCKNSRLLGDEVAFGVICAAESYDKFIQSLYKKPFLRLSVHAKPVFDTQGKIGIFLNKLKGNFPTPWHSAAVRITDDNNVSHFVYEKKNLLEKAGCEFIPNTDGKGAYYVLPQGKKYDFTKSFKENFVALFS